MGAISKMVKSGGMASAIQKVVQKKDEMPSGKVAETAQAATEKAKPFTARRRGQAANILAREDGIALKQKRLLGE